MHSWFAFVVSLALAGLGPRCALAQASADAAEPATVVEPESAQPTEPSPRRQPVPAPVAAQVTKALDIPTIGIGAGPDCDAQVLVWTDMAGLTSGRTPRFVKRYADLRGTLLRAARDYADDVRGGTFPAPEHSFDE